MTRDNLATAMLLLVMALSGAAAWMFTIRPLPRESPSSLRDFSRTLNAYQGTDIAIDDAVESMLRADFHVQRVYDHPHGERVFLYVGYYSTQRGGAPEHTPDVCYPSQGWQIFDNQTLPMALSSAAGAGLKVQEYVVRKGEETRLIHYWYRTYRRSGIVSRLGLQLDHALSRLLDNRADGALVRLSIVVNEREVETARSRLRDLHPAVETALDTSWPKLP